MTSRLLNKIDMFSKDLKMKMCFDFKPNTISGYPYEQLVCECPLYPKHYFLVHKNVIFNKGTYHDAEYDIHKFDKDGEYVGQVDLVKLDNRFFSNMKEIKYLR